MRRQPSIEAHLAWRTRRAALALFSLLAIGGTTRADDSEKPAPSLLPLRMFRIAELTARSPQFFGDPGPGSRVPVRPPTVDAESGDDPVEPRAVGSVDEAIAWLREHAGAPSDWTRDGVEAKAVGESEIHMRAPTALLDAIDRELAVLARDAWPTVTVDVAALSGDATAIRDGDVAAAIGRGALSVLGAARACGAPGARVVGRHGGESTFVEDYDVEVTKAAKTSDPIVGLRHDGICFDATTIAASTMSIRLSMNAWWSRPLARSAAQAREAGAIQLDGQDERSVSATVDLGPGAWAVLGSAGAGADGVVFAVRATLHPYDVSLRPFVDPFATSPLPPMGPLVRRAYPLHDLFEKVQCYRGRSVDPTPSNFVPIEPPELPEALEPFPAEHLVEVIREAIDPAGWFAAGASVELKAGRLYVRTDAARQAAIEHFLDAVRRERLRSTRIRAVVATMPLASLPEYFTGLDDAVLVSDGGAALLARPGARVVERAALSAASGQWQTALVGRQFTYVADFDVEIAEDSSIGDPIVKTRLEGTSFDVQSIEIARGGGVVATIRLDRSAPRATHSVATPFGDIECPDVSLLRMHGTTTIPLGATRLVGANILGSEVTLVLVSATGE